MSSSRRARERLLAGGVPADEAPGDAEVLARHALGWDLTRLRVGRGEAAPPDFADRYDTLIARRLTREPVSHIVGQREFWGLDFEVTRDVLTPRPETELVVQAALDVCTHAAPRSSARRSSSTSAPAAGASRSPGEGIARRRVFIASDVSLAALTVARRNAARHGVGHRIAFVHSESIPPSDDVEIVVSNPPYIPTRRAGFAGAGGSGLRAAQRAVRRHRWPRVLSAATRQSSRQC